mmetsp:Transcript_7395/g.8350  ORF Transcript_7395/g.8350 Transcript_7395/m.8350 type:complete len:235 (-) Transcript_7395:869-1573(-)
MAHEKRQKYGQMIQKQILKLHRRKQEGDDKTVTNRHSQGNKNKGKTPDKEDSELQLNERRPKRSVSVFQNPVRIRTSKLTEDTKTSNEKPPRRKASILPSQADQVKLKSKLRSRQGPIRHAVQSQRVKEVDSFEEEKDQKLMKVNNKPNNQYLRSRVITKKNTVRTKINSKKIGNMAPPTPKISHNEAKDGPFMGRPKSDTVCSAENFFSKQHLETREQRVTSPCKQYFTKNKR